MDTTGFIVDELKTLSIYKVLKYIAGEMTKYSDSAPKKLSEFMLKHEKENLEKDTCTEFNDDTWASSIGTIQQYIAKYETSKLKEQISETGVRYIMMQNMFPSGYTISETVMQTLEVLNKLLLQNWESRGFGKIDLMSNEELVEKIFYDVEFLTKCDNLKEYTEKFQEFENVLTEVQRRLPDIVDFAKIYFSVPIQPARIVSKSRLTEKLGEIVATLELLMTSMSNANTLKLAATSYTSNPVSFYGTTQQDLTNVPDKTQLVVYIGLIRNFVVDAYEKLVKHLEEAKRFDSIWR